jgi:hypothetical protein
MAIDPCLALLLSIAVSKTALVAGIASIAYAAPVVAAEAEVDQVDATISSLVAAVQVRVL